MSSAFSELLKDVTLCENEEFYSTMKTIVITAGILIGLILLSNIASLLGYISNAPPERFKTATQLREFMHKRNLPEINNLNAKKVLAFMRKECLTQPHQFVHLRHIAPPPQVPLGVWALLVNEYSMPAR